MTRWPPGQRDLLADQRLPAPMGPGAHHADPVTSHAAADAKRESRTLGEDQYLAYTLVSEYPGSTCIELARAYCERFAPEDRRGIEFHRQRVGRRLSELQRAGLIVRRGERDGCGVWWPV